MPSHHRHIRKRPIADINVVPYIDVMLVLLIIFMVTAPMLQHGVEVDLPNAATVPGEAGDDDTLVINVDREGKLYSTVGENPQEPVTLDRLQAQVAALQRRNPKMRVYVGGDRRADYGAVVTVFVALQAVGKDKVFLMTEAGDDQQP